MRLPTFQSENTSETLTELTKSTALLNFNNPKIQELILERGWQALPEFERIGAIYDFVRNEIKFGYNESDNLPASRVLEDGVGQCNTKGILLMALLRANQIACRFHGFTIDKLLQKGAITGWAYVLAPRSIIHSWVEIWHNDRWINLEGFILDENYLRALQRRNPSAQRFIGFGAAVTNLSEPPVEWSGGDTYIQREGINADFGIFNSPDYFYQQHGTNLSGFKKWVFETIVRSQMNGNVERIRDSSLDQ